MVEYQRGVTWGGFLLVLGTIALLSVVPLPFPEHESLGFFLWYWLGWASLGAFTGMTVVAAKATHDLRVLWHVAVASVTLLCLSLLLGDQHFFSSVPSNLLCSFVVVAMLWKCMVVNRQLPAGVRSFARPITTVTALAVVIRLAAPPHFFLPIVYNPQAALARSRAVIVTLYLSAMGIAVLAGWLLLWLRRDDRGDSAGRISFLERTISRAASLWIFWSLAAIFGTLIFLWYFVLGLCSMSGGSPYPYFTLPAGEQASNVRAASEYLTARGAHETDEHGIGIWYAQTRWGAPLATYEYPLHFGRVMKIAIFPDRDKPGRVNIAYDCRGITAMDMGEARQFTERMRTDFRKQAIKIRQARADG